MSEHRDALLFVGVSAVTLAVVEGVLLAGVGRVYTDLYRSTRQHSHPVVRALPLVAAAVTFAHLEDWLPARVDPFHASAEAMRRRP